MNIEENKSNRIVEIIPQSDAIRLGDPVALKELEQMNDSTCIEKIYDRHRLTPRNLFTIQPIETQDELLNGAMLRKLALMRLEGCTHRDIADFFRHEFESLRASETEQMEIVRKYTTASRILRLGKFGRRKHETFSIESGDIMSMELKVFSSHLKELVLQRNRYWRSPQRMLIDPNLRPLVSEIRRKTGISSDAEIFSGGLFPGLLRGGSNENAEFSPIELMRIVISRLPPDAVSYRLALIRVGRDVENVENRELKRLHMLARNYVVKIFSKKVVEMVGGHK